jgi:membrane-associated protease RseP (regulator of RpoE activity)
VSCKAIDRQVAGRQDAELAQLLEKFVCVRVVQGWGLDLSLFQFDYELTWAVFFMNADRTIYGRYGTRSDHKDTSKDISLEGLKKAMEGALEIHKGYPGNKKELAGKTGPKPAFPTPESIPELRGKPNIKPADGTRGGCVHCHQAGDAEVWSMRNARQPLADKLLWPYPMPDRLGLSMDPKERATVAAVAAGSPAEKGGFKVGDRILKLEAQPILSTADVQWVLHNAKDPGTVKAEVERGGQKAQATLALAAGWRQKEDFTWRVITWGMRHKLLGTEPLEAVSAGEKRNLGLADGAMALRVKGFPPDWVKEKNTQAQQKLKQGDVIITVDGKNTLQTEGDLLGYLMQKKSPGQPVDLTVVRGGKPQKVQLTIP